MREQDEAQALSKVKLKDVNIHEFKSGHAITCELSLKTPS